MLWKLLVEYLRPQRRLLLAVVIFQLAQSIASLYLPTLNADIIDEGVAKGDTGYILRVGSLMLVITLLQIACAVVAVYFGAKAAMGLGRDLRGAVFTRVGEFSEQEVTRFGAPSLITRSTNDVQQVQQLVLMSATMMVAAPMLSVGGVIMAVRQDAQLSWLIAVSVPVLLVGVGLIITRMVPLFRKMQVLIDTVNRVLREQLTGIRVVRAFVREDIETARFARANEDVTDTALRAGRLMALAFPVVMLVLNVSSVAVIWFGSFRIEDGSMQVGTLIAFLSYLLQILMSVMMATFMAVMIPRAAVSADRIGEVLTTESSVRPPEHPVTAAAGKGGVGSGELEMHDVGFAYPGAEQPVLSGISFTARSGQTTAIIGSTGSGKTTLVNLLPRLFDATSGSVKFDGVDVRELQPDQLWGHIGLVPQRPYLFSGTVRSNLLYGKPDASEDELWRALATAQAQDFVREMEGGLDAPISQGGTNVSGGQRQRIAIARALVKRPELYIFDDSFSSLDTATDARLRQALRHDTSGATLVIIAQRVSSIADADQILVLDDGRIVGHGTHDELLETSETYREIVSSQLAAEEAVSSTPGRPGPAAESGTTAVGRPPRPPMGPGRGGPFAGMNIPAEKALNFWPSARRLLGTLRPERLWLVLVIALSVAGVTLSVIGPRLLGEGTNIIFAGVVSKELPAGMSKAQLIAQLRASGENQKADMLSAMALTPGTGIDFTALATVLLWALVLYVLSSAFMWVQAYVLNGVVQRTVYRLRERIEAKINRLPLRYFDSIQRGELLSRVTNDVDNISQSLQQSISQAVMSLLTVLGVLLMMFLLSPTLALIALVTIPLTLVTTAMIAKRSQKLFVAQWKHTGELNGQIEETYTGHALVKVFGRQQEVGERFRQKNAELYEASFGAQFISGLIMPAMTFIGNLVYVGIAVVGGLQVASGAMQLGDVQAFIQYSRQFTQPLAQLGSMANLLQSGVASAERVFSLLDEDEQSPEAAGAAPVGGRGRLVFENVSFSYSPDKPLISDLSLVAEPGQTVAIVGPTGAGKTTLVNLMMRFYEIDAGRITLDGVDVTSVSRRELRSRMGMVLQDTWLFGGTIRDNIAYGRPDASEEEILEAARATYVDRFVHSLPEGYDTVLEDEGSNVSAGEKQLLTIARAFLARPSVLILDEATSSVDTRTEVLVQKAMSALRSDRTSFVIAHRLSTIRDADLILVMEAGQIVEQGTHASLLAAGGAYARLYEAQFAAPVAEV